MSSEFYISQYARAEARFARHRSGQEELERSPAPLIGWGRKTIPYILAAMTALMIWRLI